MSAVLISNELLQEAVRSGRPIWCMDRDQRFTDIFVYCPRGHLNRFPLEYPMCLCGFLFTELIEKYKLRFKGDIVCGERGRP